MSLIPRNVSVGSPVRASTINGILGSIRQLHSMQWTKANGGAMLRSRATGGTVAPSYRAPFEVTAKKLMKHVPDAEPVEIMAIVVNSGIWFGNTHTPYYGRKIRQLYEGAVDESADTFFVPETYGELTPSDFRTYGTPYSDESSAGDEQYDLILTVYIEPSFNSDTGRFEDIGVFWIPKTLNEVYSVFNVEKSIYVFLGQFKIRGNITKETVSIIRDEDTIPVLRSDFFFNKRESCLYTDYLMPLSWHRVGKHGWLLTDGSAFITYNTIDNDRKIPVGLGAGQPCGTLEVETLQQDDFSDVGIYLSSEYTQTKTNVEARESPPVMAQIKGGYYDFQGKSNGTYVVFAAIEQTGWNSFKSKILIFNYVSPTYFGSGGRGISTYPQSVFTTLEIQKRQGRFPDDPYGYYGYLDYGIISIGVAKIRDSGTMAQGAPDGFLGTWRQVAPIAIVRKDSAGTDVFPITQGVLTISPNLNFGVTQPEWLRSENDCIYSCKDSGTINACHAEFKCPCFVLLSEGRRFCPTCTLTEKNEVAKARSAAVDAYTGEAQEISDAANME